MRSSIISSPWMQPTPNKYKCLLPLICQQCHVASMSQASPSTIKDALPLHQHKNLTIYYFEILFGDKCSDSCFDLRIWSGFQNMTSLHNKMNSSFSFKAPWIYLTWLRTACQSVQVYFMTFFVHVIM